MRLESLTVRGEKRAMGSILQRERRERERERRRGKKRGNKPKIWVFRDGLTAPIPCRLTTAKMTAYSLCGEWFFSWCVHLWKTFISPACASELWWVFRWRNDCDPCVCVAREVRVYVCVMRWEWKHKWIPQLQTSYWLESGCVPHPYTHQLVSSFFFCSNLTSSGF